MTDSHPMQELAIKVVVATAAGVAGMIGPESGAVATGLSPLAEAGLARISQAIRSRRLEHAAQTVMDAAEAFGAETVEEIVAFVEAAVSDEEHQELLARALTIAQDTAMRDKRRALGRALASAASDVGTRLDEELLFIRVLDDLDEPHVRLLRLLSTTPRHLDAERYAGIRQWFLWSIKEADPGLGEVAFGLLLVLERHGLAWQTSELVPTPGGLEHQYEISSYGDWFLARLAEPGEGSPHSAEGTQ